MAKSASLTKQRRALTKLWWNARVPILIGVAVIIGLAVLAFGYLKFQERNEVQRQASVEFAVEQISKHVGGGLGKIRSELTEAVNTPEVVAVVNSGDPAKLAEVEKTLGEHNSVISVSLLPLGYSDIDRSVTPPIGYAVLDMLKTSVESGEKPPVEVHLFGSSDEHIVILTRILDGDKLVGHARWALNTQVLQDAVATARLSSGYAELGQRLGQGKPLVLAQFGEKRYRGGAPTLSSKVKGTAWQVYFWKELSGASEESAPELPIATIGGVGAGVLVLLAVVLVLRRRRAKGTAGGSEETVFTGEAVPVGAKTDGLKFDALDAGPPPLPEVEEADMDEVPTHLVSELASSGGSVASSEIFRAYDIRGIVGKSLSADIVRDIGRAIGTEAYERQQQTVVVGCDGRLTGPRLLEALIEGLRSTGRDVIDVGKVPTPVLYFATHYLNTGSGVIVTGSHNPPDYNGLKIMLGGDTLFGDQITALKTRIDTGDLMTGEGGLQQMDVLPEYIRRVTEDIPVALGNSYKVVVDCGNGIAGDVAPKLIRALGHDVIELFCEVDGNFPNHHPDPSKPENLRDLITAVKENEADIGFAFDGDGDRLGVVDETGRIVWPDLQMMLYARDIISRNPGAQIVFDVKCTNRLAGVIKKLGGEPLMWKTGHSFIKSKMKETGALLGGEMSGHIFFKERWYGFDDALYASARMLELLLGLKQAPSTIFAKLPTGVATPELTVSFATEGENHAFIAQLARAPEQFGDAKLTTIDGIRADYSDGWGLVRASNTTPSIVLRFEADDAETLSRIQEEFRGILLAQRSDLSLPF